MTPGSDRQEIDTSDVQTAIGTTVYETPWEVRNPVTGDCERIRDLSQDGYKRRFLAVLHTMRSANVVDLDSTPAASFDKDKWEVEETDGSYVVVRSDADLEVSGR